MTTTLEEINDNIKCLFGLVQELTDQNTIYQSPVGEIHQFLKGTESINSETRTMFANMLKNLENKYKTLETASKEKDVLIASMEKIILKLNDGEFPEEIKDFVNHYENELQNHKENAKKHFMENKMHKYHAEVSECHHYEKDKMIDKHENTITDQKHRLVECHRIYNEEIDARERQILRLQSEVKQLKLRSEGLAPEQEQKMLAAVEEHIGEVIDHYEGKIQRLSQEIIIKDNDIKNHKWEIEKHETDHFHKDKTINGHNARFEEHSQSLKEHIMELTMELAHKEHIITTLKKSVDANAAKKAETEKWQTTENMEDLKLKVEEEMAKLKQLMNA